MMSVSDFLVYLSELENLSYSHDCTHLMNFDTGVVLEFTRTCEGINIILRPENVAGGLEPGFVNKINALNQDEDTKGTFGAEYCDNYLGSEGIIIVVKDRE